MKNVLLVNTPLTLLLLRETSGGRVHAKRMAEATPYPWLAGSRLGLDLGLLACTLPQGAICMPTQQPRGQELTREQALASQTLPDRQRRIAPVTSSVRRGRMVKDRLRVWKDGGRDHVMALCCALQNCRIRLTPWQPMV